MGYENNVQGQVTIPKKWREKFGLWPRTEVEFVLKRGLKIVKRRLPGQGKFLIKHMRGRGTVKLSTDEIMVLTPERINALGNVRRNVFIAHLHDD